MPSSISFHPTKCPHSCSTIPHQYQKNNKTTKLLCHFCTPSHLSSPSRYRIVQPHLQAHFLLFFSRPLLGLVMFAVILSTTSADESIVLRPAWGVSFARISVLQTGNSHWTHTFAVEVPQITADLTPPTVHCPRERQQYCETFVNQTDAVLLMHVRALSAAQRNLKQSLRLIPGSKLTDQSRRKRGLFDFAGQFLSRLFRLATGDSVRKASMHVARVEREGAAMSERLQKFGKSLSSLVKQTDARFANAVRGIRQNHQYFEALKGASDMNSLLTALVRNALVVSTHAMELERLSESFLLGIQTLLRGYLPLQLVSPDKIRPVLDSLFSTFTL